MTLSEAVSTLNTRIMKKTAGLLLFCMVALAARAQDRGIGLRIGDPTGISYKKYLPRHKAIELGVGTSTIGWHHAYYRNAFRDLDKFEPYEYRDHHVTSTLYLQAKYLLQYDIPVEGMVGRLAWYWGVGALLKVAKVEYRYDEDGGPENLRELHTDIDIGPEGILGMEYTFDDVPLTVFGDISLLIEIVDRPGIPRGFSAIGIRYDF